MPRPLIALDCDGVLLDFNLGYASAWERAFGNHRSSAIRTPTGRWTAGRRTPDQRGRARFRAAFDTQFWSTMPPIDGRCRGVPPPARRRPRTGLRLGARPEFQAARLRNLRELGFPIERVIATGNAGASAAQGRRDRADPAAFVDDYLSTCAAAAHVHTALVLRAPNGSPNVGPELALAKSVHEDLGGFADHWLAR